VRTDPPAHRGVRRKAAEVHHVEIENAKLHYHAKTDEVYYIIDGQGTMVLDDETIEIHRGVVVYVPRGSQRRSVADRSDRLHSRGVLTTCMGGDGETVALAQQLAYPDGMTPTYPLLTAGTFFLAGGGLGGG
jgi:mannose-6-phosphate isomerase-like protein (cupin superfamily)